MNPYEVPTTGEASLPRLHSEQHRQQTPAFMELTPVLAAEMQKLSMVKLWASGRVSTGNGAQGGCRGTRGYGVGMAIFNEDGDKANGNLEWRQEL